jgi:hypothetical protein
MAEARRRLKTGFRWQRQPLLRRCWCAQDAVHPNQAGYDVMGPLAEKAIEQALKGQ